MKVEQMQQAKKGRDIVSKRNRLRARIWRLIKKRWFLIPIFAWGYWCYVNPVLAQYTVMALSFIIRLVFMMSFMILQFVALFWFMARTRTEVIKPGDPKVITFDDYKGQEKLVEMFKQWMSLLYDREEFQKMGGSFVNGILLAGPPGVGKSYLCKAASGTAGIPFISIDGSSFSSMFFGVSTLKLMAFVGKAKKLAKEYGACLCFIDEIDALGASRGGVMGGNNPQGGMVGGGMGMFGGGQMALTRLLYEMDGIEVQSRSEKLKAKIYKFLGKKPPIRNYHVLFLGATNRPGVLDPALTRPGRFDRTITVEAPDKKGRREIVRYYLDKVATDDTVNLEAITEDTAWATPALINSAITKDSVRLALFDGRTKVSQKDVDQALQEQAFGLERPIEEMKEDQKIQIAYHEAGHALAMLRYRPEKRIVRASIVGRGSGTLGYVQPVSKYEEYARPIKTIVADIMVALAGHAATKVALGEYWTGAYSDFQHVRAHIRHLYSLGYFGPPIKEATFEQLDEDKKVKDFWNQMEEQCEVFVKENFDKIQAIAQALLEKETLSGTEVQEIIDEIQ